MSRLPRITRADLLLMRGAGAVLIAVALGTLAATWFVAERGPERERWSAPGEVSPCLTCCCVPFGLPAGILLLVASSLGSQRRPVTWGRHKRGVLFRTPAGVWACLTPDEFGAYFTREELETGHVWDREGFPLKIEIRPYRVNPNDVVVSVADRTGEPPIDLYSRLMDELSEREQLSVDDFDDLAALLRWLDARSQVGNPRA